MRPVTIIALLVIFLFFAYAAGWLDRDHHQAENRIAFLYRHQDPAYYRRRWFWRWLYGEKK
jgi:hypothetical protein